MGISFLKSLKNLLPDGKEVLLVILCQNKIMLLLNFLKNENISAVSARVQGPEQSVWTGELSAL